MNGKERNLEIFTGSGGLNTISDQPVVDQAMEHPQPKKPSLTTKTRKDYLHRDIRGCTITKTKQQQEEAWRGSESGLAPVLSKMSSFSTKNPEICKEKKSETALGCVSVGLKDFKAAIIICSKMKQKSHLKN